jgi:WD40 repeat protein
LSEIDGRPSNSRKDFIDLIFFGGIENGNVITWKIRKFLRNANSDSIQFSQAEILTIQKAHDICINSLCLLGDNGQRLVTGAQDCKIKLYDVMEKPISDNNRTISLEFVSEV